MAVSTRSTPPLPGNGANLSLDRELLKDKVAYLLREALMSGELEPNAKLVERELASYFGVSKGPVRDALMGLEKEGIVVSRIDARYVAILTDQDLRQLYLIRRPLERIAAQLACSNSSPDMQERLQRAMAAIKDAVARQDRPSYRKLDRELHHVIWTMAGNTYLLDALTSIVDRVWLVYKLDVEDPLAWDASMARHATIVRMILAGDADAVAQAMDEHLTGVFGHPIV